jgi:hypothetical protein
VGGLDHRVAVALRGHAQAAGAGLADGDDDVVIVEGQPHQRRALVDGRVEDAAGGIPAELARPDEQSLAQ